jgi:hypothetical protein
MVVLCAAGAAAIQPANAEKHWTWYIHNTQVNFIAENPSSFHVTIGLRADSELDVGRLGHHNIEGVTSTDLNGDNPTLVTNHLSSTPGYQNMNVGDITGLGTWELFVAYTGAWGSGVTITTEGIPVATIEFPITNAGGSSRISFNETVSLTFQDDNDTLAVPSYDNTGGDVPFTVNEVLVQVKAWLQGPYQAGGSMAIQLYLDGVIPLTSPYTDGREVSSVPAGVVDWVSLELRIVFDGAAVSQRSFFLTGNGFVVDEDGTTMDLPMSDAGDGDYYILLRHRNHLAVMSATARPLNGSTAALYDFSLGKGQYYGSDAALLETGVYGLYTGDASGNGQVQNDDKNDYWKIQVGQSGYRSADFNLNGQVQNDDKNDYWKANVGKGTQVQ